MYTFFFELYTIHEDKILTLLQMKNYMKKLTSSMSKKSWN